MTQGSLFSFYLEFNANNTEVKYKSNIKTIKQQETSEEMLKTSKEPTTKTKTKTKFSVIDERGSVSESKPTHKRPYSTNQSFVIISSNKELI